MANDLVTGLDHAEHGVDLGGERIGEFEVTALIFRGFARSIEASVAGADAKWAQAAERDCRETAGPTWVLGSAQTKLAVSLHLLGRAEPAVAAASRALAQFDAQGARQAMADGWRVELAAVFYAGGRQAIAQELLREGAVSMRHSGVDEAPNQFLIVAAVVEFLRGELRRSAQLLGAARSVGGADEARRLRDQGWGMALDEAFAFALKGIA